MIRRELDLDQSEAGFLTLLLVILFLTMTYLYVFIYGGRMLAHKQYIVPALRRPANKAISSENDVFLLFCLPFIFI